MMAITRVHPSHRARTRKLPFASPHGILYALPISAVLWVGILLATGLIH